MLRRALACATVVLAGAVMLPLPAAGQTVTSALLSGVVRDGAGVPLNGVRVVAEDVLTGFERVARSDADGRFEFRLLAHGEYTVLAEKLGYRPQQLISLHLRASQAVEVELTIVEAEPPVLSIDSLRGARGAGAAMVGSARWFGDLELSAPRSRESNADLLQLSSWVDADGSMEGLPGMFTRDAIEGFAFDALGAPGLAPGPLRSARALEAIEHAELSTVSSEIDAAGSAGARLVSYGRRGSRGFMTRAWGLGADPAIALGRFSDDVAGAFDLGRAGLEVSGSVIPDSAVFRIGAEWRNTARVLPRVFRQDQIEGASVATAARNSADLSLLALSFPFVDERQEMSAWGRFDWRLTDNHELSTFADVSLSPSAEDVPPLRAAPVYAGTGEWLEAAAGVSLRSTLSRRFSNEVRAALVRSTRDQSLPGGIDLRTFSGSGVAATSFAVGDLLLGADPYGPFSLARTGVQVEQALLVSLGSHLLKVGFAGEFDARDYTLGYARAGSFAFGGADDLADGRGAFFQTVGATPTASWSTLETGAFFQDRWRPVPGLELIAGLRVMGERLPSTLGSRNGAWQALTGLRNDSIDDRVTQLSPRFDLRWDVGNRGTWFVGAGVGVDHDDVSPDIIAELIANDGRVRARRALGDVGDWPAVPDSVLAPVQGPLLALLGPEFVPPRSTRASFGLSRSGTTSLHLSAAYRHTDFLPTRRDLNRQPAPNARDQYGRAVFGELAQEGALVGALPGSNRRFADFDVVSALESTAFSDYWGATALLERRFAEHVRFAASYTFSRTRDNWLVDGRGVPTLAPQLGDSSGDDEWVEGTSDFDVPHRVSVLAELMLPLPLGPTIGVSWRARSARPYTPGFRTGVDVNGDYASNDPAFIDPEVEGMDALLDRLPCLRDGSGEFAERNSCRGDALHFLDLRFGFDVNVANAHARIFADALNVLEQDIGMPDRALYLIDPDGQLATDAEGVLQVPLIVNPSFGQPLRALSTGRVYRLGIEVAL